MTTEQHRDRHRARRQIRRARWPSPAETGEVYLCYSLACVPPADTDDFPVLTCSGSLAEARNDAQLFGGAAIYVCDYHAEPDGDVATNERFVEVCLP